jgi:DNA-binding XRE family transcriptional regulator
MKSSPGTRVLPLPARKALIKLGQDLSAARRRRRIPVAMMAERAFISRKTLGRVERGDPGVSLGIYASVLFVLGMTEQLTQLADPKADTLGLMLEEEQLPKRIRIPRRKQVT